MKNVTIEATATTLCFSVNESLVITYQRVKSQPKNYRKPK